MGQKYDRWGVVAIEPVLAAIRAHMDFKSGRRDTPAPGTIELLGQRVRITSLRLQTFASHPPVCASPTCGCKATHFAIERTFDNRGRPSGARYHLNLYGRDARGQEVLFTHDHTLARALGGADDLSNTKPMCGPCNLFKSKGEHALLRRQRAAKGLDPHTGNPWRPASPEDSRRNQKLLLAFHRQARLHGMDESSYREHCEARNMGSKGVPDQPFMVGHPRQAALLGLSEGGYAAFKRDEVRYQGHFNRALRTSVQLDTLVESERVRDALFEHMEFLADAASQPLSVFRAHVEAQANFSLSPAGNENRSPKHMAQAARLGLSPIGLDYFRANHPLPAPAQRRKRALA